MECRSSLVHFYKKLPIDNTSRSTLVKWLYDIHNMVNNKLSVDARQIPSLDTIKTIYSNINTEVPLHVFLSYMRNIDPSTRQTRAYVTFWKLLPVVLPRRLKDIINIQYQK